MAEITEPHHCSHLPKPVMIMTGGMESARFHASGGTSHDSLATGCALHDLSFSSDSTGSDLSFRAGKRPKGSTLNISASSLDTEDDNALICEFCSKPRPATPYPEDEDADAESMASSSSSLDYVDMTMYNMAMDTILFTQAVQRTEEFENNTGVEAGSSENPGQRGAFSSEAPLYPHRPMRYSECEVCLVECFLRRRVCCDFKICDQCLNMYIELKVREARVQVECPNDRCQVLVHVTEIKARLPSEMKDRYNKFLVDANADPCKKTCPGCSIAHTIDPDVLVARKKVKMGLKVKCRQCRMEWCFLCQAPFHTDLSCKQFRKGDEMVRRWAKERHHGQQSNAQRCPKCKIFIQKIHGCDHMKCNQCNTDFCYNCGDRYIRIKFLGNHWSRFSLFGCKYHLLPQKPVLRRLIRGANFAARLMAGTVLAGLGLAAGVILVGASVIILPGYGVVRLRRRMSAQRRKMRTYQVAEVMSRFTANQGATTVSHEESEDEEIDVVGDGEVEVTVHPEPPPRCQCFVNQHTDLRVGGGVEGGAQVSAEVVETAAGKGGYSTVVANIVSRVVEGAGDQVVSSSQEELRSNTMETSSQVQSNTMETSLQIQSNIVEASHARQKPSVQTLKECEEGCIISEEKLDFKTLDSERLAGKRFEGEAKREKDFGVTTTVVVETEGSSEQSQTVLVQNQISFVSEDEVDDTLPTEEDRMPAGDRGEMTLQKEDGKPTIMIEAKMSSMVKEEGRLLPPREDRNNLSKEDCKSRGRDEGKRAWREDGKTVLREEGKTHTTREDGGKPLNKSTAGLTKDSPNGCFGNIFSSTKRSSSLQGHCQDTPTKVSGQPTKAANKKSATWEKMRRNKMESLLIGCSLLDSGHNAGSGQRITSSSGSSAATTTATSKLKRSNSEAKEREESWEGLAFVGDHRSVVTDSFQDCCAGELAVDSSLYDENGFYISQHTITTYL